MALTPPGSAALAPPPPTLFLTDADVSALADWQSAVQALAAAYAQPMAAAAVPPRAMARGDGIWLRSLSAITPAVTPGGTPDGNSYLGCKLIAASPRASRASYLVALFDADSMALAALIDGNQLTGLRTAATAAVAADLLAPQRPLRVALLGSGFEARAQLQALAAVRPIATASVYSPNPASRRGFIDHMQQALGLAVVDAATPQQAVNGADLVVCAARARGEAPVLHGDWLAPGMSIISIGSTLPEQRELDVSVLAAAALIVADQRDEVLHDTGDLLAAERAGLALAEHTVPLADLASGRVPARRAASDIVVYKSVGSALQDVVLAGLLLQRARAAGRGTPLPVSILPVAK